MNMNIYNNMNIATGVLSVISLEPTMQWLPLHCYIPSPALYYVYYYASNTISNCPCN